MTLPETHADAGLSGRQPTRHEQMAGRPWDVSYQEGPAPWDIGRPQGAFARLAEEGGFEGPVLDAGCGTGEHALLWASMGLTVVGVDVAETALAMARRKAEERGLRVEFVAADARHLEHLGERFRTVVDCGLFHALEGEERAEYVASLASVTEPGARLFVLCFSDVGDVGPHPVREDEIRAAFTPETGWSIVAIETERIETRMHEGGVSARMVRVKRA